MQGFVEAGLPLEEIVQEPVFTPGSWASSQPELLQAKGRGGKQGKQLSDATDV